MDGTPGLTAVQPPKGPPLSMILTAVLSSAGAIALLLIWRHMSVARGARKRDEALSSRLAPLAARFEAKRPVAQEEVAHLAGSPELRQMLYAMCSRYQRLDLFPAEFLRKERQAEAVLAYWLRAPIGCLAWPDRFSRTRSLTKAWPVVFPGPAMSLERPMRRSSSSGTPACTSGGKVLPGASTKAA